MSGSEDRSIRVWGVGSGAHEATLEGHSGAVTAMVVHGRRLISAAADGTMRIWGVGTWELLRTVVAYPADSDEYISCLSVSGWHLVSGSCTADEIEEKRYEVGVWELERLECEHRLPQPPGVGVGSLLSVGGEVWGGVGRDVVRV